MVQVVKVLMAALALAGVDPAGFAALGTGAPEWTLVAAKVTETLVEALAAETDDAAAFEADASAAAALPVPVATARALVEDLDEGAYASFYAASSIAKVLKWAQTLFALYDAVKADVDAKAEAAAAAAAED